MRAFAVLAAVAAGLTFGSCGSHGCCGNGPSPLTISIPATASLDGWVASDGTALAVGAGPYTGDLDASTPNVGARQFFSFDLSGIPAGVTITEARLVLHQAVVLGTPFATHGVVEVDHLDYGATLDAGDFALPELSTVGVLSSSATLGLRAVFVTTNVQADIAAARTRSQYRVQFTTLDTDNDGVNDMVQFVDAEQSGPAGSPPELLVTYQP